MHSGLVTDEEGSAITGALVVAGKTTISVVTDTSGYFQIKIPNGVSTLLFYRKGMKKAGADIGFHTQLDVRMVSVHSDLLSDMALEELLSMSWCSAENGGQCRFNSTQ